MYYHTEYENKAPEMPAMSPILPVLVVMVLYLGTVISQLPWAHIFASCEPVISEVYAGL